VFYFLFIMTSIISFIISRKSHFIKKCRDYKHTAHYYSRVWDPLTLQAYYRSVGGASLTDTESISAILFGS